MAVSYTGLVVSPASLSVWGSAVWGSGLIVMHCWRICNIFLFSEIIKIFPLVSANQFSCDTVKLISFSWNLEVYHLRTKQITLEMILMDRFYDTS